MPRRKALPGQIFHDDQTKHKISNTQKQNVLNKKSNLVEQSTCIYCGFTTQTNMIIRWHNENCYNHPDRIREREEKERQETTWLYVSPKLRFRTS